MMRRTTVDKLYCNCAKCDIVLLSQRFREFKSPHEVLVRGRIEGRPYCQVCYDYIVSVNNLDPETGRRL